MNHVLLKELCETNKEMLTVGKQLAKTFEDFSNKLISTLEESRSDNRKSLQEIG